MGPKRKKSKPNPESEDDQAAEQHDNTTSTSPAPVNTSQPPKDAPSKPFPAPDRSSWYNGGSWRAKASPVASIARESISVTQGTITSESSSSEPVARRPSSVSKSVRGSRKSIPLAAEATRVHATSDVNRPRFSAEETEKGKEKEKDEEVVLEDAQLPPVPAVQSEEVNAKQSSAPWFAWWSRPDGYGSDGEKQKSKKMKVEVEEASHTPLPGTPTGEPMEGVLINTDNTKDVGGTETSKQEANKLQRPEMVMQQPSATSWFGLWSSAQNQQAAADDQQTKDAGQQTAAPEITVSADPPTVEEPPKTAETKGTKLDDKNQTDERLQTSGWAFWSSDKSKDPAPTPGGTQKQVGELAVADTPSQSNPEAAQFNEQRDESLKTPVPVKSDPKRTDSLLKPKRGRPNNSTNDSSGNESSAAPTPPNQYLSAAPTPAVSQIPSPSGTPPPQQLEASSILTRLPDQKPTTNRHSRLHPNLVLPSFQSTFPLAPNPGYMERLTNYLAQSLHLPGTYPPQQPRQHVFKSTSPPKIKKAVAIGVHGFFPGALIQKFIAQPRGTSVRLANYAATAVKAWCHEHQPDSKDKDAVEVEKVALEGEGYISDRVSTLWKLLLNWLSHIRHADFILVACHSQGVPVAIMLVAKLIQLGCLAPHVRVGVCAMAGINLGPFLEYRSRLFGGTALELFEFGDPESSVSKAYREGLDLCLRHGVRVTFVGSIDDQLVSLESSLCAPLSHPYVNRAVFVDGRIHAPNFLTHLVIFALKLRNLGVGDHGLIRELSAPLAGSIVGGEGHSRIYDEPDVYRLAVDFALESTDATPLFPNSTTAPTFTASSQDRRTSVTTSTLPTSPALASHLKTSSLETATTSLSKSLPGISPVFNTYEPPPTSASANPFVLPWAVRGMLEEELVKREMRDEVEELVREFEAWKPTSKVLRDVRWRLEGVRGMI